MFPDSGPFDQSSGGYDALQTHELTNILCSFYGPNAAQFASYLQRGLFIDQNQAVLRINGVGLVEVGELRHIPELIKDRWWQRSDFEIILRREIRYDYDVRNLLRSTGEITAQPPGETRLVEDDYDTGA
jgi:hypothetical protein